MVGADGSGVFVGEYHFRLAPVAESERAPPAQAETGVTGTGAAGTEEMTRLDVPVVVSTGVVDMMRIL